MFSTDKIFFFCLALLFLLSSCNKSETPAPSQPMNPESFIVPGCTAGSARWFELEQIGTNNSNQDLGFFLSTDGYPFMYDHCLCSVEDFKIPVGQIAEIEDPVVLEYDGTEELEFYVKYADQPAYDTIVVINPEEIIDPGLELMITFRGDFNATVGNAGGLCIVDNLSGIYNGNDTNTVFLEPWKVNMPPATPFSDSILKVYIPYAMTLPL